MNQICAHTHGGSLVEHGGWKGWPGSLLGEKKVVRVWSKDPFNPYFDIASQVPRIVAAEICWRLGDFFLLANIGEREMEGKWSGVTRG